MLTYSIDNAYVHIHSNTTSTRIEFKNLLNKPLLNQIYKKQFDGESILQPRRLYVFAVMNALKLKHTKQNLILSMNTLNNITDELVPIIHTTSIIMFGL